VLENSTGGAAGTLIASLDNCATACGRRLLRQWLLRPLGRIVDIEARQDAVEDLISVASQAVGDARRLMAGTVNITPFFYIFKYIQKKAVQAKRCMCEKCFLVLF
jgi:DNA mismatch repair protein MSH6